MLRVRSGHIPDEVNHGIAIADIEIQLVERDAAIVLEVFLNLDLDIVTREIAPKLIPVIAKFVRDCGKENLDRHNCSLKTEVVLAQCCTSGRPWGSRPWRVGGVANVPAERRSEPQRWSSV